MHSGDNCFNPTVCLTAFINERFANYIMAEISEDEGSAVRKSSRNIACFFAFGILSFIYDTTSIAASEDVLSGSDIPTAVVSIAISAPILALKVTAPWFPQKCSYLLKSCLVVLLLFVG